MLLSWWSHCFVFCFRYLRSALFGEHPSLKLILSSLSCGYCISISEDVGSGILETRCILIPSISNILIPCLFFSSKIPCPKSPHVETDPNTKAQCCHSWSILREETLAIQTIFCHLISAFCFFGKQGFGDKGRVRSFVWIIIFFLLRI